MTDAMPLAIAPIVVIVAMMFWDKMKKKWRLEMMLERYF
jgi:hypothetical protein